jgi:phosphatidylinositol-bisphosphatase
VCHGHEGIVLLNATADGRTLLAEPIYRDAATQIAPQDVGFSCELTLSQVRCKIDFNTIEALQDFLLPFKRLAAWAVERDYHVNSYSHRWLAFYRPIDGTIGQRESLPTSRKRSTTVTSHDSGASSTTLDSIISNPFFLKDSSEQSSPESISSQSRVLRIKNRFVANALAKRRSEFVETQSLLVRCTTWNMAGTDLIESFKPMLQDKLDEEPKLYAFAFQEMDLSRQAYLSTSQVKADKYRERIASALGEYFEIVASHQLVGILLCVYAHKSIMPAISEVETSAVPTGFAGLIGNKGAVGIRFKVFDSCFGFVNCHLAAGQAPPEKRNADLEDIAKRIFNEVGVWESGIEAIDNLFYMGDLNYRVNLGLEEAHEAIKGRNFKALLAFDQLSFERRNGRSLQDFAEAEITFAPTYKFDIGTDDYDTSEKQRVPAYTDRVLVRSNLPTKILEGHYHSWPEYIQSDHKPVSAVVKATYETILTDRLDSVRQEVMRDFDRHENKARPTLTVTTEELDFGLVRHRQSVVRTLQISNEGRVASAFEFVSRDDNRAAPCKRWCLPMPQSGLLEPGERMAMQLTVCPDALDAITLNEGSDTLSDILVLAVEGGKDAYISITGQWQRSCCGQSLSAISKRTTNEGDEYDVGDASIPREIFLLCDLITEACSADDVDVATLLERDLRGDEIDALEKVLEQSIWNCTPLSGKTNPTTALALLLQILATLDEPVVPCDRFKEALVSSSNTQKALDFLDTIPSLQANVLIYLIAFVRSLLEMRQGAGAPKADIVESNSGKTRRVGATERAATVMGPSAAVSQDPFTEDLLGRFGRVLLQPKHLRARYENDIDDNEHGHDEATRKRNLMRHWVLATMNQM